MAAMAMAAMAAAAMVVAVAETDPAQHARTGSTGCAFFVAPFAVALVGAGVALFLVIRQWWMGIGGPNDAGAVVVFLGFFTAVLFAFGMSLLFLPFYFLLRAKKVRS